MEIVRKHTETLAEYYLGVAKTAGLLLICSVILSLCFVFHIVKAQDTDMICVVIIFAGINLCLMLYILRQKRKARFVLKSSRAGTVWARDVVVTDKRCVASKRNQHRESYYIDVHIENHNGSYEEANRCYNIPTYIYSVMHKGSRFIDVRYDPELDCEPYLIIEHLWRACS